MSDPEAAILKLPDELLLEVAKDVDVIGLRGLSLTCRRMQPIAQEALIRNATLSPMHIWKLVETLRNQPGLVMALTHLRLGPVTYQQTFDMREISKAHETQADHSSCCEIMPELYLQADKSASEDGPAQAIDFYSAGVVVLVALAKGLQTISTGTSVIDTTTIMGSLFCENNESPSRSYEPARLQLKARLEELNIIMDTWRERYSSASIRSTRKLSPPLYMDLSQFELLKRLTIPFGKIQRIIIAQPSSLLGWMGPAPMLPRSLETICVTNIGLSFDVAWFEKLLDFISALPTLRKVEMQFHFNLLSTAWYYVLLVMADRRFLPYCKD
jgi:hypothetical protein